MKRALLYVLILVLCSSVVSSFSFANLLGYVTKNSAPSAYPTLPVNDGVTNQLIFKWEYKDAENDLQTEFLLQLDDDWRFETPYNLYGLGNNFAELKFPIKEGTYYWRVQVKDNYGWSSWSGWRKFDLDLSVKTCNDGTPFWKCSVNIPKYCDGGVLIEDCRKCGCNMNELCQQTGSCLANTCLDGTRYGQCSKSKPRFCQNGKPVEICSLCGCSSGLECNADGTCSTVKVVIKEEITKPESKTLLEHIVWFFKKLFGGS